MDIFKKNKGFWTFLSFITFVIFVIAISFKIYWLNIVVIFSGFFINRFGIGIKKDDKNYKLERRD